MEQAQEWFKIASNIRLLFIKYNQIREIIHKGFGVSDPIAIKHSKLLFSGIDNLKYNLDECIFLDYYINEKLQDVEINGKSIDPRDFFYSPIIEVDEYVFQNEYPKKPYIKKLFIEDKMFIQNYLTESMETITNLLSNPLIQKHDKYYRRIKKIVGKLQKNIDKHKINIDQIITM